MRSDTDRSIANITGSWMQSIKPVNYQHSNKSLFVVGKNKLVRVGIVHLRCFTQPHSYTPSLWRIGYLWHHDVTGNLSLTKSLFVFSYVIVVSVGAKTESSARRVLKYRRVISTSRCVMENMIDDRRWQQQFKIQTFLHLRMSPSLWHHYTIGIIIPFFL